MRLATLAFAAGLTLLGATMGAPQKAQAGVYVNVPGVGLYVGPRYRRHYYRRYGYYPYYGRSHYYGHRRHHRYNRHHRRHRRHHRR